MPTRCFVQSCFNTSNNKGCDVTFHQLPTSPHRRRKWLIAVKRNPDQVYGRNVVCSAHFLPQDFVQCGRRKRLKFTALPSQNLPTVISDKRKYHFEQPLTTLASSTSRYWDKKSPK